MSIDILTNEILAAARRASARGLAPTEIGFCLQQAALAILITAASRDHTAALMRSLADDVEAGRYPKERPVQ